MLLIEKCEFTKPYINRALQDAGLSNSLDYLSSLDKSILQAGFLAGFNACINQDQEFLKELVKKYTT